MITLKINTDFGLIEVSSNDVRELKTQVASLEGSSELYASIGRTVDSISTHASATSNVGKVLGGQVVDAEETENETPVILGQPALEGSFNVEGQQREAWYDPRPNLGNIPATDNPNDPELASGTKRFWKWK